MQCSAHHCASFDFRCEAARLIVAAVVSMLLAASCSSSSSGKGLSEQCQTNAECTSNFCVNVTVGNQHSQCTAPCVTDADCQKIDSRAVCHNGGAFGAMACVLGCAKDSDCPVGAHCTSPSGGGCFQN
jgi:hypothetical protein